MTLADEDTNSILADYASRAFQGNVAIIKSKKKLKKLRKCWENLKKKVGKNWNKVMKKLIKVEKKLKKNWKEWL